MIIISIVAFFVAFFQTIYNALKGNIGTKHVGLECTTGAQGMLVRVLVSKCFQTVLDHSKIIT